MLITQPTNVFSVAHLTQTTMQTIMFVYTFVQILCILQTQTLGLVFLDAQI
jgi:hypothetical protein